MEVQVFIFSRRPRREETCFWNVIGIIRCEWKGCSLQLCLVKDRIRCSCSCMSCLIRFTYLGFCLFVWPTIDNVCINGVFFGVDCKINIHLYNIFHNIFVFFLVNKKWLEDKDEKFVPSCLIHPFLLHLVRVFPTLQKWWDENETRF